jgi:hypothetical protein
VQSGEKVILNPVSGKPATVKQSSPVALVITTVTLIEAFSPTLIVTEDGLRVRLRLASVGLSEIAPMNGEAEIVNRRKSRQRKGPERPFIPRRFSIFSNRPRNYMHLNDTTS